MKNLILIMVLYALPALASVTEIILDFQDITDNKYQSSVVRVVNKDGTWVYRSTGFFILINKDSISQTSSLQKHGLFYIDKPP